MSSILIVDDERAIRDMLNRWLAVRGYDIRQAQNAETALEMMTSDPSDVVLCDVEMPGHGGLWLISRLRERCPLAAVVLATGVDSVPPSIGLRDGVTGYLVKPFNRDRVLTEVETAVKWHDAASAAGAGGASHADVVAEWLSHQSDEPFSKK